MIMWFSYFTDKIPAPYFFRVVYFKWHCIKWKIYLPSISNTNLFKSPIKSREFSTSNPLYHFVAFGGSNIVALWWVGNKGSVIRYRWHNYMIVGHWEPINPWRDARVTEVWFMYFTSISLVHFSRLFTTSMEIRYGWLILRPFEWSRSDRMDHRWWWGIRYKRDENDNRIPT